jgi:hypothetical protein
MLTQSEYKNKPNHCPSCSSDMCEGEGVTIETGIAYQSVGCNDCGAEWVDNYELKGYTNLKKECVTQLKIDIKHDNVKDINVFYYQVSKLAQDLGIEIMDDGNAPYTEDMTEQYKEMKS